MIRTMFMGTPDFALPALQTLARESALVGVVTQPDKPKGRGYALTPPPVKVAAQELSLPIYQPETLKDEAFLPTLNVVKPDLIVVVAYGKILPPYVLNFPKYGCINIHASLLPKYRGAAPIQRCIMEGERESGVTIMQMERGLDTGDILLSKRVPILPEDTGGSLHDKLAVLGAQALSETLAAIETGALTPVSQDDSQSTYAAMLDKETARIDWNRAAGQIVNQIRALNPFPLAWTRYQGKQVKILRAEAFADCNLQPGQIGPYEKVKGLPVGCGLDNGLRCQDNNIQSQGDDTRCQDNGSHCQDNGLHCQGVWIQELKLEGKKAMSIHDYMRGNSFTGFFGE